MKKINMDTLEQAEHKISANKVRKAGIVIAALLLAAVGGYGAFRMLTGDVIASRFTVNQMYCPACTVTVKEAASKLPGVVDTEVSLASQDVTVKFREKQTKPEHIQQAIVRAGYPARLDGLFKPQGAGIDDVVVATVNGKPIFKRDLKLSLDPAGKEQKEPDAASSFFSVVGKEILLQAADAQTVVIQPQEIEAEIQEILKKSGISKDEFMAQVKSRFGSEEKFRQIVGQRLGIRKLLEDTVLEGVTDPEEKTRKTMEWTGKLFREADVRILDSAVKEKIRASAGQDDWKTFWPRMIASQTDLKALLTP